MSQPAYTEAELEMVFASYISLTLSVTHTSLFPISGLCGQTSPSWLLAIKPPPVLEGIMARL